MILQHAPAEGITLRTLAVVLLTALALVLTACGTDDETGVGDPDGADASAPDAGSPAAGPTVVELVDFEITAPASAPAGTFTVTNAGNAPHTFTAADGTWDTGTITGGDEATVTIDQPGTHDYVCTIHPAQMSGTIEIT